MPPQLPFALSILVDFLKLQQRVCKIEGFLSELEGYTLTQLAAYGQGDGAIVEIGSFLGRSTAYLAMGAKLAGRGKVYAVDHFRGSSENQPGEKFAHPLLANGGSTFQAFQDNLRRVGLLDLVTPIEAHSTEAAARWKGPIRLLFIDGEHSHQASKADFQAWSPFVSQRGYVCFHDITVWAGVTQMYQELRETDKTLREVFAVQSLRVLQRLP